MKKLVITSVLTLGLAASSFAQGFFSFNNLNNYDGSANATLPFIGSQHAAGEGAQGAIIGSDGTFATANYDIGYLFLNGTTFVGQSLTPTAFMGDGAVFGSIGGPTFTTFTAATGDFADGAGIVQAGSVTPFGVTPTVDHQAITIQLVAWYDPTGSTTFAEALAAHFNTGGSVLSQILLVQGLDLNSQDITSIPGFAVTAPVPEPATFALAGLGGLGLLLFRRRQS